MPVCRPPGYPVAPASTCASTGARGHRWPGAAQAVKRRYEPQMAACHPPCRLGAPETTAVAGSVMEQHSSLGLHRPWWISIPSASTQPGADHFIARLPGAVRRTSQLVGNEGDKANLYATIGPTDRGGSCWPGTLRRGSRHAGQHWAASIELDGARWSRLWPRRRRHEGLHHLAAAGAGIGSGQAAHPVHIALTYDGSAASAYAVCWTCWAGCRCCRRWPSSASHADAAGGAQGRVAYRVRGCAARSLPATRPQGERVGVCRRAHHWIVRWPGSGGERTVRPLYEVPYTTLAWARCEGGTAEHHPGRARSVRIRHLPEDDPEPLLYALPS